MIIMNNKGIISVELINDKDYLSNVCKIFVFGKKLIVT